MPDPEQTDTPASADQALPYLRALYANVLEWYKIAETKGQLLLTLNGLLVTAVAGALIVKPPDAATRVDVFGVETWAFVASLVVTVSASVACAAMTVASRLEDSKVN